MKKTFSLLCMALCGIVLTGCSRGGKDDTSDNLPANPDTQTAQFSLEECKQSVTDYLDRQKSATVDNSKTVVSGSSISVDYIGRLEDGTVFDTSVELVAKNCNLYTPQRDYSQGLPFVVGQQQMIAGFDKGVVDMHLGETKSITIPSEEAYGGATITLPLEQLPTKPDGSSYAKGEKLQTMNGEIEILDINTKEFTINNIHPLAGKDLIFDMTVKTIQ